jgi:hypothetical protein
MWTVALTSWHAWTLKALQTCDDLMGTLNVDRLYHFLARLDPESIPDVPRFDRKPRNVTVCFTSWHDWTLKALQSRHDLIQTSQKSTE